MKSVSSAAPDWSPSLGLWGRRWRYLKKRVNKIVVQLSASVSYLCVVCLCLFVQAVSGGILKFLHRQKKKLRTATANCWVLTIVPNSAHLLLFWSYDTNYLFCGSGRNHRSFREFPVVALMWDKNVVWSEFRKMQFIIKPVIKWIIFRNHEAHPCGIYFLFQ